MYSTPCGRGVEYAPCFSACRMKRLKGCPDDRTSTAWDYAGLLCNLYRNASPKRHYHSQTSRAESLLNSFYTWSKMLPTGLHYSTKISIPHFPHSNSSILPLHLPSLACARAWGNHHHKTKNSSSLSYFATSIIYAEYKTIFIHACNIHVVLLCLRGHATYTYIYTYTINIYYICLPEFGEHEYRSRI